MKNKPLSTVVADRLQQAARSLGAADPLPFVRPLLDRTFYLPEGDARYAASTLTPGAAPFEPSFSEKEPRLLRFSIEPLGPESSPVDRKLEATREMRRLVGPLFGQEALRWFDQRSEDWRGMGARTGLHYGAFFGTAYDGDGLHSSKVYYEMTPSQLEALPPMLRTLVRNAILTMPELVPVFTTIACRRHQGSQRITFYHRGPLRLADLSDLMARLNMEHQLPSVMQIVGLALGGRFELPDQSVLLAISDTNEGPELKLEVLLTMIPDLPPTFLELLSLGLAERPRELSALRAWLQAFTPEEHGWPGRFSVLSVRVTPTTPARVSLYLRPVEFEIKQRLDDAAAQRNGMALA